jgi:hypothetical protein
MAPRQSAESKIADRQNVEIRIADIEMQTSLIALPYPNISIYVVTHLTPSGDT